MHVRLDSVGCRLNTSEIEAMARVLAAAGHRVVGPGEEADLFIFNSCSVTSAASRKSRHFIRQVRRKHPAAALVVTGCHAELEPEEVAALGVDHVVGNRDKERIPEILAERGVIRFNTIEAQAMDDIVLAPGRQLRTRAFLKVQDGCDNRCAYCVVTVARGEGRSLHPDEVLEEVNRLTRAGYREVVLSGVHLGSYGHDLGERRGLEALITRILDETEVSRLRLSSLEPWDLTPDFFTLLARPRLMPHLHLPLQSGCDHTLRRMARRSSRQEFSELVRAARDTCPDLSISTDVMVGFPGETDEHFEQSWAFVARMAFSRLHVFRFSPRPGTAAAAMTDVVPEAVAKERSRRMHILGAELQDSFHRRFLGRDLPVLWEEREDTPDGPRWTGLTPNYIRVVATCADGHDLANQIIETKLESAVPGAVVGRVPQSGLPVHP